MAKENTIQKKKLNKILEAFTATEKKRQKLIEDFKGVFPIKAGEKVRVMCGHEKKFLRYAYLRGIKIRLNHLDKPQIEFIIDKARADGSKAQISDTLRFPEYIQKID